jgi:hypothetical protein
MAQGLLIGTLLLVLLLCSSAHAQDQPRRYELHPELSGEYLLLNAPRCHSYQPPPCTDDRIWVRYDYRNDPSVIEEMRGIGYGCSPEVLRRYTLRNVLLRIMDLMDEDSDVCAKTV